MAKCVNPTQWQWLFVACKGRGLKKAQIKWLFVFSLGRCGVLSALSVQAAAGGEDGDTSLWRS